MVLTGQVQRELVNLINRHGPFAGNVRRGRQTCSPPNDASQWWTGSGWTLDLSVTSPTSVPAWCSPLLDDDLIPVVSSIARDAGGDTYNINADAGRSCRTGDALGAKKLIVPRMSRGCTGRGRTTRPWFPSSPSTSCVPLLPELASGMIPKMAACVDAVSEGVARAHVIDGGRPTRCWSRPSPMPASAPWWWQRTTWLPVRAGGRDRAFGGDSGGEGPPRTISGSRSPAMKRVGSAGHRRLMNNYGVPPLTIVSGSGAEVVVDADGNRYLDLLAGIAVNASATPIRRWSRGHRADAGPWVTRPTWQPPDPPSMG